MAQDHAEFETARQDVLELQADVLVIGGGMAAAWAAIAAARGDATVLVADKGYVGTSGVTAAAGPGHWFIPDDAEKRAAAMSQREAVAFGLADREWMARILQETWTQLPSIEDFYKFPRNEEGVKLYGPVRGPEYMRALRQAAEAAGVRIMDQSPALNLLRHKDGSIAGAQGLRRQTGETWRVRSSAVVLATGGCAFFSRLLGSRTNTGDGYLMAAEAGVAMSGMEFSTHFTVAPAFSTMARAMSYAFANYYGPDQSPLHLPGSPAEFTRALAKALQAGPVYCDLGRMPQDIRDRLPYISPNVMPPFTRNGIDPFTDKFPITLVSEGTIRGVGGIKIEDKTCQTSVPGLFAAGDAASRELVAGATTGGGNVNSAWALSSGYWAGQEAARRARRIGVRVHDAADSLGRIGLYPTAASRSFDLDEVIQIARAEATGFDRGFFSTEQKLKSSLAILEDLWQHLQTGLRGDGRTSIRAREAVAIVATARWSFNAALHRRESRGMHVRTDFPDLNPAYQQRQVSGGLDHLWAGFTKTETVGEMAV